MSTATTSTRPVTYAFTRVAIELVTVRGGLDPEDVEDLHANDMLTVGPLSGEFDGAEVVSVERLREGVAATWGNPPRVVPQHLLYMERKSDRKNLAVRVGNDLVYGVSFNSWDGFLNGIAYAERVANLA